MAKTSLYKLFGIGRMPDNYRAEAEREGIILFDEGIRGTVTYRDFRGGGRYANWKRQWYSSSIVLTKTRLLALRLRYPIIDVPFTDERIGKMQFSVENANTLLITFDASLFQPDWSGNIDYRFRTPLAAEFLQRITAAAS